MHNQKPDRIPPGDRDSAARSGASAEDAEDTRPTDYGADVHESEARVVSTDYDPRTTARLRRAGVVFVCVLAILFIAVRIDRSVQNWRLARATERAAAVRPPVDVIEVQPVGAAQSFALPGETAAWHASTIYARVNGYVGKWLADIGDRVHKGQALAVIETPDLDAQLAAARAELRAAQAQVLVREAEARFAHTTYDRWRDSPKGVVSDQEREEKRTGYESAVAQLKAAEAQVGLDQARVEQYAVMSRYKQVTAPFDGVVTSRYIDIGNLVTAGSTTSTTPLYVVTQNDPLRIFVDVPQSAAPDLMRERIPVAIRTADGASRGYDAHVTRTAGALNAQARTLRVEVDIPNSDQHLVPGMYVKVDFSLMPRGLVQVPAAALLFRAEGPQVARVDASGRISFQGVTIARDDGNVVELSSGVRPGERLALNLSSQISDGQLVHVNEPARAHDTSMTAQR